MPTKEWFETRVMIAAEDARRAGFGQTYAALLDVLRASRCSDERIVGSFAVSRPAVSVVSKRCENGEPLDNSFTNS